MQDKVVVITGAGSGIGLAAAREFDAQGALVVLLGRSRARLEKARLQLRQERHLVVPTDVGSYDQLLAAVKATVSRFGHIDVIVNNAAVNQGHTIEEVSRELFEQLVTVNFLAPFYLIQLALPHLGDGGSVINISSTNGLIGHEGKSVYAGTKGALISMTRSLAVELAPRGVRVNCICPGVVKSLMHDEEVEAQPAEQRAHFLEMLCEQNLQRRISMPEETANLIVFLASAAASFITGAIIPCDGGGTAGRFIVARKA